MQEVIIRDLTGLVRTNVVLGLAVAVIYAIMLIAGVREAVRRMRHRHSV